MKNVNASIITIGDELLIGQTIDTNSAWIGRELNKIGVWLKEEWLLVMCGMISGMHWMRKQRVGYYHYHWRLGLLPMILQSLCSANILGQAYR
jgi:hypothetical protein